MKEYILVNLLGKAKIHFKLSSYEDETLPYIKL